SMRAWATTPSSSFRRTSFRFKTMSVTSSRTPGSVANSCSTPSIFSAEIAAPCRDESSTRRSALPMVVPKPRSKGSPTNLPYVGVRFLSSLSRVCGLSRSRQLRCGCIENSSGDVLGMCSVLLRVELDDELLVDRHGQLGTGRQRLDAGREAFAIDVEPVRRAAMLALRQGFLHAADVATALAHVDDIARLEQRRGNVHLAAVDHEMTVLDQLPRFGPRRREPHAVDHVVQAALEQLQQGVAGDAARALGHLEVASELVLEQAVHALDLLLLAQLQGIFRELRPALPVLAGRVIAALDGALVGVAALAFQEQLEAFPAAKPADRISIPCQWTAPPRGVTRAGASAPGSRCGESA